MSDLGAHSRRPGAAELLDAIEVAARDVMQERVRLPPRQIQPLGVGVDLFVMLATSDDLSVAKLLTIGAAPAVTSLSKLFVVRADGAHVGEFDAAVTTAERTAAVSFACLKRLRRPIGERVLIVGAGRQARAHVDVLAQLAPATKLFVTARQNAAVDALLHHARRQGMDAQAATSLESAVATADLIITATTSRVPVIPDRVRDDAVVVAVGNYRADASELPQSLVVRSRCYADSLQGARHEAGEYLLAGIDLATLEALDSHEAWHIERGRPAIVKSVGSAAWDLAWARAFLQGQTRSA